MTSGLFLTVVVVANTVNQLQLKKKTIRYGSLTAPGVCQSFATLKAL